MTDRPILFSGPMVQALLDGRKTQTRRVMKPQPEHKQVHRHNGKVIWDCGHRMWCWRHLVLENIWDFPDGQDRKTLAEHAPYAIGDRLWVRETWAQNADQKSDTYMDTRVVYRADGTGRALDNGTEKPWRPSLHMPRWASRLTLTVTDVRAQRVQDISEVDAMAEAARRFDNLRIGPRWAFANLWDSLNAKRGFGWEVNPWVWAYTFTVERRNIDEGGPQ